ncbi:hypothetical protein ARMGADRAFT_1032110 [Armillaria gallica]|uniref:Uncharacterized protein n=1 Tax=Armillaria gallica TaxID=47427 RepID=A0A2H3DPN7_ARMGA|nr:hypothetical protein ARMGADRAFT_1032110 [Armillaria gallica]
MSSRCRVIVQTFSHATCKGGQAVSIIRTTVLELKLEEYKIPILISPRPFPALSAVRGEGYAGFEDAKGIDPVAELDGGGKTGSRDDSVTENDEGDGQNEWRSVQKQNVGVVVKGRTVEDSLYQQNETGMICHEAHRVSHLHRPSSSSKKRSPLDVGEDTIETDDESG